MTDRGRGRVFFDTNVILYLLSADEHKADRAEAEGVTVDNVISRVLETVPVPGKGA